MDCIRTAEETRHKSNRFRLNNVVCVFEAEGGYVGGYVGG